MKKQTIQIRGKTKMELQLEEEKVIADGLHKGVITDLELRETKEKWKYIDVIVEFSEHDEQWTLKRSYPAKLMKESVLGQLLTRFGANLDTVGKDYDISKILVGRQCQFITIRKGKYAEINRDSLKPTQ